MQQPFNKTNITEDYMPIRCPLYDDYSNNRLLSLNLPSECHLYLHKQAALMGIWLCLVLPPWLWISHFDDLMDSVDYREVSPLMANWLCGKSRDYRKIWLSMAGWHDRGHFVALMWRHVLEWSRLIPDIPNMMVVQHGLLKVSEWNDFGNTSKNKI